MPNTSDVATLDGIIAALYEVISGPAGRPRDWNRFRGLMLEDARLIPVSTAPGASPRPRLLSCEEYIRRVEPIFAAEDFYERETARQTEMIDNVAHVLSSYESRHSPSGEPYKRGKNSIQLVNDGARWWIVNVMWTTSRTE